MVRAGPKIISGRGDRNDVYCNVAPGRHAVVSVPVEDYDNDEVDEYEVCSGSSSDDEIYMGNRPQYRSHQPLPVASDYGRQMGKE